MAARSTYLKIGLFVVLAFAALVATGVLIGLQRLHRRVVPVYTYFDESVNGLDIGSPVRARGVSIGQVGEITFAPDHRRVQVRGDIEVDKVVRLGLPAPDKEGRVNMPSNVRAQLASLGLTGGRFIALDFVDEKANPPPMLSFRTPMNYVPAVRSFTTNLEESVTSAMNGISSLIENLRSQQLPERVTQATIKADDVLALLQQILRSLERQRLPQRASSTVEEIRQAASGLNHLLEQVGSVGLVATTEKSVGAVGEAGRRAADTTRDLGETLEEIRAAAASIRLLADRLERDPDMLLKGRAEDKAP
jgi:paraquat-inducible protein B